ncbi:hypothetical protein CAP35_09065 [Chitinophagaceae bacterium IBVUCB1]|nr:hypothetical protein CAP35_09065 [Chitinophagaceae bacterium IBVUCB1]
MRKSTLILLFIILPILAIATTRKVLFIGNSYVFTNNMPLVLQQLATSLGDTLIYEESVPGGFTFQGHSTDANTLAKIKAQQWDIVVLQEQSQRPAFSPGQVATDVYPFARKLDSLVRDNKACTETMFFMTWGRKNGDASNCASYPPICTYEGMQQRLRESYLQMAQDNNAIVSPVGAAWKQVRDSFSSIDLYSPDESHPSVSGTYLAACVFYASIFHKNPIASTFNNGLPATDANNLKRIAGKVVLDSFSKWNMHGNYTYANFNKSVAGKTATFTNTSVYSTNNYWTFGDGGTSTAVSPSRAYAVNGKYQVTLTASNTCFTETKKDSVVIGTTSILQNNTNQPLQVFSNGNTIHVLHNGSMAVLFELFDTNGRRVFQTSIQANTVYNKSDIAVGNYIYRCSSTDGKVLQTNKINLY